MLTKTKKRKKRKIEKKKKLSHISKEYIANNQCWIPPFKGKETKVNKMPSCFTIKSNNSIKNIPKKHNNMEKETTYKSTCVRANKIYIYPDRNYKDKILKFINKCPYKAQKTELKTWPDIKKDIIDSKYLKEKISRWIKRCPDKRKENLNNWLTKQYPIKVKQKLLEWFEIYRRVYNLTISNKSALFNEKGYIKSFPEVRKYIKNTILPTKELLLKDIKKSGIPEHTLDNAIHDVLKAYDSANGNKAAGNISSFRLRYKKYSSHLRTLVLEPTLFSKKFNTFKISVLGNYDIASSKPFDSITKECRLSYNFRTNEFILYEPYDKGKEKKKKKIDLISLDPGMRTFQTGYSPDGICYKFIVNPISTINKKTNKPKITNKIKILLHKIDNVVKARNHKKFLKRIRKKITDIVTDLHWKTTKFLCTRFNNILVGNMSTTGIVKREKSFMSDFDKRYCIALSHYKFRERLISKAEEHNVVCNVVDESYTTKTCGLCGELNDNVEGNKVFKCPVASCSYKMDRDYHGGRNIYLKTMSKL